MQHRVTFISEGDLPSGHDWALMMNPETGRFDLLIKPTAITAEVLMECWSTFLEMTTGVPIAPPLALPAPRMSGSLVAEIA